MLMLRVVIFICFLFSSLMPVHSFDDKSFLKKIETEILKHWYPSDLGKNIRFNVAFTLYPEQTISKPSLQSTETGVDELYMNHVYDAIYASIHQLPDFPEGTKKEWMNIQLYFQQVEKTRNITASFFDTDHLGIDLLTIEDTRNDELDHFFES